MSPLRHRSVAWLSLVAVLALLPFVTAVKALPDPGEPRPLQPARLSYRTTLVDVAASGAASSTHGFDISWPQCHSSYPAPSVNFAIIGVTGGKAFTENECFTEQYRWAQNAAVAPQVYMNVNGLPSTFGSALCGAADGPCNAYQYGWAAAADAVSYAARSGGVATTWWLDVETENKWTGDHFLNERVIAGAKEYLEATGHRVGIYSTPYQFGLIAGGYRPHVPNWTAGAEDYEEAVTRCSQEYSFGGPVVLVQFVRENFDQNYAC